MNAVDVGLTHVALTTTDIQATIAFYERFAGQSVVHRRTSDDGDSVVWMSDRTRPFVIVFLEVDEVVGPLLPFSHLGVACATLDEFHRLCQLAEAEGVLIEGPHDSGPPVGWFVLLRDPAGHTLELSYGQQVATTVALAQEA